MKMRYRKLLVSALVFCPFLARAAIFEGFDDGYPGAAGGGWTGGWTEAYRVADGPTDPSAVTVGVNNTNPLLSGSGNYLTIDNGPGNRPVSVDRGFQNHGGVNLASNHTVSFDFRVDDITAFENSATTWIRIYSCDSANSPNHSQIRWWVGARTGQFSGNWMVRDGNRAGGQVFRSTGIPVLEGVTYSFSIDIVPATGSYYTTLSDSEGSFWQSPEYGFRGDATIGGSFISFDLQKGEDVPADRFVASIDNISIIPEPGVLAMCLLGVGALALARRRR